MERRLLLLGVVLVLVCHSRGQVVHTDTCGSRSATDNVYSYRASGDSLCSSFVITIKKEVVLHKHLMHSEHVLVLEGEGEMQLREKVLKIKKGDLIFIPKNTPHAAWRTGKKPLKVLSVQAPYFDGKDRVAVEK